MSTMNIRVIYHSSTGNTEKLARTIADTLNVEHVINCGSFTLYEHPYKLEFEMQYE